MLERSGKLQCAESATAWVTFSSARPCSPRGSNHRDLHAASDGQAGQQGYSHTNHSIKAHTSGRNSALMVRKGPVVFTDTTVHHRMSSTSGGPLLRALPAAESHLPLRHQPGLRPETNTTLVPGPSKLGFVNPGPHTAGGMSKLAWQARACRQNKTLPERIGWPGTLLEIHSPDEARVQVLASE